ncbi:MAG: serine--tRNA ligase [Candidatus Eisenbacteria bacterium]|nr:serine--tRNA ligase [Candidatus Eisenbacteria bacterium]
MLDPRFIRSHPEEVARALTAKGEERVDLDQLLDLDRRYRENLAQVEQMRSERNRRSQEVAQRRKAGEDAEELIAATRRLAQDLAKLEETGKTLKRDLDQQLTWLPNIPHPTVPVGPAESANQELRRWGDFPPPGRRVPHWELGPRLDLFDNDAGAKISGSGFTLYKNRGARLVRALINFMLDLHTTRHGYTEVAPPFIVRREAAFGTGQLPKLAEDMYVVEVDDLFLIPTAEVPLTNIYRDEILPGEELPIYITAYSPCFRREAGAYGRDTRGLVRVHQFDKVEMVKFVRPDDSYAELETLVGNAEAVLQALELPYRVVLLGSGDLSFAAAKCYDLELWAPAEERWLEVSSCSNFEDFQARRCGIRFRGDDGKVHHVHTLNGSGVALPRLIVALLEVHQTPAGELRIPEALRPYLGGADLLPAGG